MWSAIQSDLFEFVSTVQSDTKKTLDTVLGTQEEKVILWCSCYRMSADMFYRMQKKNIRGDSFRTSAAPMAHTKRLLPASTYLYPLLTG